MLITDLDQDKVNELEALAKSLGTVQYGSQIGGYKELNAQGDASAQIPAGAMPISTSTTGAALKAAGLDAGDKFYIAADNIFIDNRPQSKGDIFTVVDYAEGDILAAAKLGSINLGSLWLRMYDTDQGAMQPLEREALFLDSGAMSFTNRYRELYLRVCELFDINPNNPLRQILPVEADTPPAPDPDPGP